MVEVSRLSTESYVNAVAWNTDGSRVAALSGFGGFIKIWETGTWRVVGDFTRYGGAYNGNSFGFLGDGSLLLPAPIGRSPDPPYQELFLSSFEQIDADDGKRIRYIEDKFYDRGRRRIMDTFAISPHGLLAAGIPTGNPSLISLFDTTSWTLTRNFDLSQNAAPRGFARSLALSADGAHIAVGTANGVVRIFSTATGATEHEKDFGDTAFAISAVAFGRDGRLLAVGGSRNYAGAARTPAVRLLDLATGDELGATIDNAAGNIFDLSFAADGLLAVAGSNGLSVWRIGPGDGLAPVLSVAGRDFYSVGFAPDGHLAASRGSAVLIYRFDQA